MRPSALIFILFTVFTRAGIARAGAPSFYREWRTNQMCRLAKLLPSKPTGLKSQTGIEVQALAQILGVSIPFASMSLNKPDYQLNLTHLHTLAKTLDVDPGYLLGEDLFRRFGSIREVEAALEDERPMIRDLMMQIYVGCSKAAKDEIEGIDGSFEKRRRFVIKSRLSRLMPGRHGSSVAVNTVAHILGYASPTVTRLINGPRALMREDAVKLGEHFGVAPAWLLGADLLEGLSRAEVDAATAWESLAVRQLVFDLWDEQRTCRFELKRVKP